MDAVNPGERRLAGVDRFGDVRRPGRLPLAGKIAKPPAQGIVHERLLSGARAALGLAKSCGNIGIESKRCAHQVHDSLLMLVRQIFDA